MRIFFFTLCSCIYIAGFAQHATYIYPNGQLNIPQGSTVVIKGGVSLGKGSLLVNNGNLYLANASNSYWTDSTYITGSLQGTGQIYLNGSAPFFVYGATNFYDLIVNCNSVSVDTLTGMLVSNQLVLQNGIIKTSKGVVTILSSLPNSVVAHAANPGYAVSYINGNLAREITANTNQYDFPVGDTSGCHLLTFHNNNLQNVHRLFSSFGAKAGTDAGLLATEGSAYSAVNNKGVWTFSSDSTPTSGNYSVELSISGFSGLQDNQFGILSRPAFSASGADWIVPPGSFIPPAGSPGRTVASGYARRSNLQDFSNSQLGVGMTSGPLPVTLTYFRGKRLSNSHVKLEWQSETESDNKGFFIERQVQGNTGFIQVGWVFSQSNGNSTQPLSYSFTDSLNSFDYSVYRLRQMDLNGKSVYSPLVIIKGHASDLRVYPIPSTGNIQIISARQEMFDYTIIDGSGRIVKKGVAKSNTLIPINDIRSGYYSIVISGSHREIVMVGKILLQKN